MSLSASCESVCQKRTLSSLLAGRVVKRPKQEDGRRLQEAAIQLLDQQQNLCSLFREVGNPENNVFSSQTGKQQQATSAGVSSALAGSLLACELRRQAARLGVAVAALSVKTVLERLKEITEEAGRRETLSSSQRVQLLVLLQSSRELLSQGALCPRLLWQELRRDQRPPRLEVLYHLHCYSIITLRFIVETDEDLRSWLVPQLKELCDWTAPPEEEESQQVQQKVLSTVVGVLVGAGFDPSLDPGSVDGRRISPLCCSLLDDLLFWLLDSVDQNPMLQSSGAGAQRWIQVFDASLCGASSSAEALQRFFTHSLTQTLTYRPRLTVSDAISLQNEWTFAKASRSLTALLRKLAVLFSVEQLLCHLQKVLQTHEVNWKHVLCFLSTLLVYDQNTEPRLRELLSRLLTSAFEGYDLENVITAFLLARQGALEGAAIFPSYSDWFKMCFGGSSSFHSNSKKSLVFLLKFLSDLVPFEPPQYLKVHILHPPYVPVKHRSLLMEYVSLAKTRLSDLKESLEDMGLYEDVSAGGASAQPQCQAVQDVEKAVSLFESTGRISAAVMEASIFRRPYFLTRFLPALLTPRMLPVKPDARMSLIEALKKAEKIPGAQYSSYVESCQKQRQHSKSAACSDSNDDPLDVLKGQLQELRELLAGGDDGDVSAQLSRISHTLSVVFPGRPDDSVGPTVIRLHVDAPPSSELHVEVVDMILGNFCRCVLDTSRTTSPAKRPVWPGRFFGALLGNPQLLSSLLHRLWDLFHRQDPSHRLPGLAAFVVHLHASMSHSPLVQLVPPIRPEPIPVGEVLSSALICSSETNMLFCVRLCVAAVCYGICRGDSLQDLIPSSFYKKLVFIVPRLFPEARRRRSRPADGGARDGQEEEEEQQLLGLWSSSITDDTWRTSALFLWRHAAFQQLEQEPQYQLSFSEWLKLELRVQRSDDVLTDAQRQEYQQWVCMDLYLGRPPEDGGCGGDMKKLCSQLLHAIMDQQPSSDQRSERGGCLPDVLSRLQEVVYEMEVTDVRSEVCDLLLEVVSQRLSSSSETTPNISTELSLQSTLHTWNRVLLCLPAVVLVGLKAEGGRTTLDCTTLIQHVNQHQRRLCPAGDSLPRHVTAHLLRGLLSAAGRCGRPEEEVNKAWSQIRVHCPLLLVSTVRSWSRLFPVLLSLWRRLCDAEFLPQQLQLVADCQLWTQSLESGQMVATPPAAALTLAVSLHRSCCSRQGNERSLRAALDSLRPEREGRDRQVLVFLLYLCVSDFLSDLLCPQEKSQSHRASEFCSQLLAASVDSSDWLLVFRPDAVDRGVYQSVAMVTSDECTRLMPWAFCSLLLQQSDELLQRAVRCPGFLLTTVSCYISVLQLFLDGHTPEQQVETPRVLNLTKQFLLRAISQTSATALSSNQLRQLQSRCADLDPEVAAALSLLLDPESPEMDFL